MDRTHVMHRIVALSLDAAAAALREDPRAIITGGADHLDLTAGVGGFDVTRRAVVTVGAPTTVASGVVGVDLAWSADTNPRAFPTAAGRLELAGLSTHPARTRVGLQVQVDPPLGAVGAVADGLGLRGVQEDAITDLLEGIVRRLTEAVAAGAARATTESVAADLSRARVVLPD